MATPNKLLSTKGQDKMPTLKGGEKAKDAGGPDLFSTASYADYMFDALGGIKQDTSAAAKAAVKAEPMHKIDAEEDKIETPKLTGKTPQAVGKHADKAKLSLKEAEESDDEPVEDEKVDDEDEPTDEPEPEGEDEGAEEVVPAEDEAPVEEPVADGDDDLDALNIEELVDEDETVVPLGEPQQDAEPEFGEMDPSLSEVDEVPAEEPVAGLDDEHLSVEEEFPVIEVEGAPEVPVEEPVVEADEELCEGCPEEPVAEAKDDEDEDPIVEGKLSIKFGLDEGDLLIESNGAISDEEKRQARALFESAVLTMGKDITKTLHEAYGRQFKRRLAEAETKLQKDADRYLTYVVEQWMKANEVALQSRLQSKLAENFMRGLKTVFEQHYIDVPESKIDVVDTLTRNVKTLRKKLQESEKKNVQLAEQSRAELTATRKTLRSEHKGRLIAEAALHLPAIDRGKFAARAAEIPFSNSKTFRKDLGVLREQYSRADKAEPAKAPRLNVPDAEPLFESRQPKVRTQIDDVLAAADKLTGGSK